MHPLANAPLDQSVPLLDQKFRQLSRAAYRREHEPMVMLEHARMCAPVPEEEEKSGMGVAMALAVASRSGLLGAMLKDDTPKTAEEWAGLSRASRRETDAVLASLASGKVVDRMGGEDARFRVPADRAGAVKDMVAVFEALRYFFVLPRRREVRVRRKTGFPKDFS